MNINYYEDPLKDNLFVSPLQSLGFAAGIGIAGWTAKGIGNKVINTGFERMANSMTPGLGESYRAQKVGISSGTLPQRAYGVRTHGPGPGYRGGERLAQRGRSIVRAGSRIGSVSRIFGYAGLLQLGFEITRGLGKLGASTMTTREDADSFRYKQMYDQSSYVDTRAAFTQRQRALQVLHNSRLSLQPVLGNESSYMHI